MPGTLQGLEMKVSDIKMSPGLLAKLASYASGKAECLKAVTKVLPELCQAGALTSFQTAGASSFLMYPFSVLHNSTTRAQSFARHG